MEWSDYQPWLYTVLFGALSLAIIGSNLWAWLQTRASGSETSLTLFIGGVLGAIALLAAPEASVRWLALVPALIDPGTNFVILNRIRRRTD